MSPQRRRHSRRLIKSSEGNVGVLPTDLILEILSRLPAKSIARFRCVSKLWASLLTLGCPYFTELFLTQSKTRPRLLFTFRGNKDEWFLYSCPQPQISYRNSTSSLSVTVEFHMSLKKFSFLHISPSVSGLMYFYEKPDLNNSTLCNPSTGHLFSLPQLTKTVHSFFGYDPVNKQFSVLAICKPRSYLSLSYQIQKLGSGRLSWKSLNCPLHHYPSETNICINGILYYMAWPMSNPLVFKIVCFDLNSEEFKFIDQPCDPRELELLVNFKGKLGVIKTERIEFGEKRFHIEVSLWVLEDADKQEWSKHVYNILPTELLNEEDKFYYVVGVTATCDLVVTLCYGTNPFYVYFFNLEKKTLQKVEIKGLEGFKNHRICGCVDYVEELRALNWN